MNSLPEIDLHYSLFLNKATVIYGESGTGKTVILKDILYLLKNYVDQIIVFSQTDKQTRSYGGTIVPSVMVHDNITDELLNDIYKRQEVLASVYDKVWNMEIIESLFSRIQSDVNGQRNAIAQIERAIGIIADSDIQAEDKNKKKDELMRYIKLIYKHAISENASALQKESLTEDEKYSLKYINLNPNLVILFDDCTALIDKFKKHFVINSLFFQGRHLKITTLLAIHTDKVLLPEHKKNSYVNIFTNDIAAHGYANRPSSDLDKASKIKFDNAVRVAFTDAAKYQKLLYIRDTRKFYRFCATPRDQFEFCSPTIRAFCEEIAASSGSLSKANKFSFKFM